jgi:hypothetical protein
MRTAQTTRDEKHATEWLKGIPAELQKKAAERFKGI